MPDASYACDPLGPGDGCRSLNTPRFRLVAWTNQLRLATREIILLALLLHIREAPQNGSQCIIIYLRGFSPLDSECC